MGARKVPVASPTPGPRPPAPKRGSALLMVLWLSAALAAIGFALAGTVRGEAERTSTALDGLRAYYLAVGGLERGMAELLWSATFPDQRILPKGVTVTDYNFPSGVVRLEILPEAGKLDVNHATVGDLARLLLALGQPPGTAQEIAAAIDDWRHPNDGGSVFDGDYMAQVPSFRAPHASFQEIEELLLVKGITRDLFYGTYIPADPDRPAGSPRLVPREGLINCLSVYGFDGRVDVNTASPAVLAALGLPQFAVEALLARRPFSEQGLYEFLSKLDVSPGRLRVEGAYIVTMRATARLQTPAGLSDLRRAVAAQIRYFQPGSRTPLNVLRWYDTAWSH
jgi:general secretion pathway protein K